MVTRRKERVLGIWVNTESRAFLDVPTYLAVLSNQPLEEIADAGRAAAASSSASTTSC